MSTEQTVEYPCEFQKGKILTCDSAGDNCSTEIETMKASEEVPCPMTPPETCRSSQTAKTSGEIEYDKGDHVVLRTMLCENNHVHLQTVVRNGKV